MFLSDRVVDLAVEVEGKLEIGLVALLNHGVPALLLEIQLLLNLLVPGFELKTVAGVAFRVGSGPSSASRLHVVVVTVEFRLENRGIVLDLAELAAEIVLRGHFSVLRRGCVVV